MKISCIEVSNVKGISNKKYNFELKSNKVNIFVAPNGYGKTSFGIAFKYLNNSKIELDGKHLYEGNPLNVPEVKIGIQYDSGNNTILIADESRNEIKDLFDVFVINSQLKASGTVQRYGGRTISRFSMDIEPTILLNSIPKRSDFNYKISNLKKEFGTNSKVLTFLEDVPSVINTPFLLKEIINACDFKELGLKRTLEPLNAFIQQINNVKGNKQDVLNYIKSNIEEFLESNVEVNKLVKIIFTSNIENYDDLSTSFLLAWQLIILFNSMTKTQVKKIYDYYSFLDYVEFVKRFINDFNTTRFTIEPKVEKNKLVINWPKAHEISNGQRDILSFVALLLKARISLNKDNQILVIDEVFDYLDDANLISFQYFITDLIEKAKSEGKNLFPILLTHLDPNYFNHFCFSDGKLKIFYLEEYAVNPSINLHKLVYSREESKIKDELDEFYFHFNPDDSIDIKDKFEELGLVKEWGEVKKFHRKIYREVTNYIKGNEYDPLAICFALRKVIEMKVYNLINDSSKKQSFLNVRGTKNKLHFAQSIGIQIPETFFLLGIIYNTSLHLYNGQNISSALAFKLENLTIKNLITEVVSS